MLFVKNKMIEDFLISVIKDSLKDLGLGKDDAAQAVCLDLPAESRFGELSTNIALRLSRGLKKPPAEIAKNIVASIERILAGRKEGAHVKEIRVEGNGFINFYLSQAYFCGQLKDIIIKGENFASSSIGRSKNVLIEFVSANPTGPLSVAHARQAAVGDSLANILESLGFKVQREYYLNDEGNQINILGQSIELRLKELSGEDVEFPQDHYQGSYIYDIAREIKDKGLKVGDFSEYGTEYILNIIKKELHDFGVEFDCWYSQKELRKSGKIDRTLEALKKEGFLYEEDGALWFRSSSLGDDKDRVVIKSDGSYTYLAPDIAYHKDKYARGFNWLINLWGPDHHGYINRLKAAVKALGHDSSSVSIIIVQLATIFREGKPVQMSTRRGQYITLREVLQEVGLDAARFFFLMRRTSSHLDFDLSVAKKQTSENPVYYVQYAHARICSILENSPVKMSLAETDFSLLKEKEEIALIKKLCQLPSLLNICLNTCDPYLLTVYLQEIAEAFHKFYDQHRVLGQDQELTKSRLALIQAAKIILATGLKLLGISRPEKM
ncbi:MAG: arginine--tRNA ligase [Candidatus Omnitrophica bacterium]|nr:arginine--tRNA ligase [Candidatus Omnitrophota bacterium]